jgi:hypothetical protein
LKKNLSCSIRKLYRKRTKRLIFFTMISKWHKARLYSKLSLLRNKRLFKYKFSNSINNSINNYFYNIHKIIKLNSNIKIFWIASIKPNNSKCLIVQAVKIREQILVKVNLHLAIQILCQVMERKWRIHKRVKVPT